MSFELFSREGAIFKRLIVLALMALDFDFAAFSLQMSDDLVVSHCELIILFLAEASVSSRRAVSVRVLVLVHFTLAEGFDWSISCALVIEENELVQDHEEDLVFDWTEGARTTRSTFL